MDEAEQNAKIIGKDTPQYCRFDEMQSKTGSKNRVFSQKKTYISPQDMEKRVTFDRSADESVLVFCILLYLEAVQHEH